MYRRASAIHSFTLNRQGPLYLIFIVCINGGSGGGVTPSVIAKTYRMPNETDATPKADMAVFEALGQSFSPDDLSQFQQQYNLPQQKVKKVIGPNQPDSCASNPNNCVEAELDVEYIMAMAQGAPLTYWAISQEFGDIFLGASALLWASPVVAHRARLHRGGGQGQAATAGFLHLVWWSRASAEPGRHDAVLQRGLQAWTSRPHALCGLR